VGDRISYLSKDFVIDQVFALGELQKVVRQCSEILHAGGFCIVVELPRGGWVRCRLPKLGDKPPHRLKKASLGDVGKREPKIRYRGQAYSPRSGQEQPLTKGALPDKPKIRYRGQAYNSKSQQEQLPTKETLLNKPEIRYRGQAYNPNSWQETKAEQNQTPDPKS